MNVLIDNVNNRTMGTIIGEFIDPEDRENLRTLNQTDCTAMETKENNETTTTTPNRRVYCVMPDGKSIKDLFDEFRKFGRLQYTFIDKCRRTNERYGFVKFLTPGGAGRAIRRSDPIYRARYANKQQQSRGRNQERGR